LIGIFILAISLLLPPKSFLPGCSMQNLRWNGHPIAIWCWWVHPMNEHRDIEQKALFSNWLCIWGWTNQLPNANDVAQRWKRWYVKELGDEEPFGDIFLDGWVVYPKDYYPRTLGYHILV
jgi:hypothetical protein